MSQKIEEIYIIIKANIHVQEGQSLKECMADLQENGDFNIMSSEDTRVLDMEWINTVSEEPIVNISIADMVGQSIVPINKDKINEIASGIINDKESQYGC